MLDVVVKFDALYAMEDQVSTKGAAAWKFSSWVYGRASEVLSYNFTHLSLHLRQDVQTVLLSYHSNYLSSLPVLPEAHPRSS